MSAQLVHKLNAMISEQEERVRIFSEQHHSTLPVPQVPKPELISQAPQQVEQASTIHTTTYEAQTRAKGTPPPPATRKPANNDWKLDYSSPPRTEQQPLRSMPKKKGPKQEEEGNIGIGMIIFSLVGIIMLLRACT